MQTTITISGQISGNSTLANSIDCYEVRRGMFNSYILTFPTKAAAKKALWEAYKSLRKDKHDAQASMLSYAAGRCISYDASKAQIDN